MMPRADTKVMCSSVGKHLPSMWKALYSIPELKQGWEWGHNHKFGKHFKPDNIQYSWTHPALQMGVYTE